MATAYKNLVTPQKLSRGDILHVDSEMSSETDIWESCFHVLSIEVRNPYQLEGERSPFYFVDLKNVLYGYETTCICLESDPVTVFRVKEGP